MFKIFLLKSLFAIIFFQGAVSFLIAAEVCYFPSDLRLSGGTAKVRFYHTASKYTGTGSEGVGDIISGRYSSAVIYSLSQLADHIPDFIYNAKAGKIHVYRLGDKGIVYLEEQEEAESTDFTMAVAKPSPTQCVRAEPLQLTDAILESDTTFITFGAGISFGFVPTLIEYMHKLGLKKIASQDMATEDSFNGFIGRLFDDVDATIKTVRDEWNRVANCTHESTPAHLALLNIIRVLKQANKTVYVRTDNIDGIHDRVGIEISEEHPTSDSLQKDFKGKKVTVLACGQSFDFHGALGAIKWLGSGTRFFSLNTNPDSIFVNDIISTSYGPEYDVSRGRYLDMGWIAGPLATTLPTIGGLLVERTIHHQVQLLLQNQRLHQRWLQRIFQCFYSRKPITIVLSKEDLSELQQLGQIWAELHKYAASYGRDGRRPLDARRLLK